MPPIPLASDAAAFYTSQSDFSTPGALASLYNHLPSDPVRLARIVRGLIVHRLEGDVIGYDIPRERLHNDAETRYVDDILALITSRNGAPLSLRREPEDRFVGICRDFSLLLCSILRHKGVPARTRSGFANYFFDDFNVDHMVTEYWDEERGWLLADAQLADPRITEALKIDFDPLDVPRDRFLVAGAAWQAIRASGADPDRFGVPLPDGERLTGRWFVLHNVRLDLSALNKVETLLWDVWGGGPPFHSVREIFAEDDRLRTPTTLRSLAPYNGPTEITFRDVGGDTPG